MTHTNDDRKQLPQGMRLYVNLPAGATEQEFSEWLHSVGLVVPAESISLRNYPGNTSAICVIDREEIIRLLTWVLGEERFRGHKLTLRSHPNHRAGRERNAGRRN